ncbi:MAG: DNA polymerase III subunit gamma/tau [Bacteroidetes bacterium HGW-Bacteroidetes-10]|jgi:DNA polymerase-3 subunit gamma/tau|nr:MAG: DNA polymerase III subunit gamma/tau [Bacteroidetes bacterium HGW-Bacteroidetes-10]
MERFIVSARKYRPTSFETLIGQENIARTLKNSILKNQLAHAYLFCGPRGVGKTTSARIFAKTINCLNLSEEMDPCGVCESCKAFDESRSFSIHELDAASNNSVDDIRQLNEKVRIPPQIGKYSVYIIDEVHMLSQAAFNAFLKTLEEPPAHAIFILATTEKHKIIPTILSRCQTYDFNRISVEDIVKNLTIIAEREKITIDSEAMHIIARKADGAMRDALTLFDQSVAFCGETITYEQVITNLNVLDYEYYIRLTDLLTEGNHLEPLIIFDEILSRGFNALHFIGGLSTHLRDLLICKDPKSARLLELAPSLIERYKQQASRTSLEFLYNALNITTACEATYKASGNQRLHIEFALVRLSRINQPVAVAAVPASSPAPVSAPVLTPVETPVQTSAPAPEAEQPVIEPARPVKEAEQPVKESAQPETPDYKRTMSIKGMMKKAVEQNAQVIRETPKEIGTEPFDMEKLEKVWIAMAESEMGLKRLATAISDTKPVISDDTKIHFRVSNDLQRDWIVKNCKLRLESFLQEKLDNRNVSLLVEVVTAEESGDNKLYMPEQKAGFLLEKHPELRELQKDIKLELK